MNLLLRLDGERQVYTVGQDAAAQCSAVSMMVQPSATR